MGHVGKSTAKTTKFILSLKMSGIPATEANTTLSTLCLIALSNSVGPQMIHQFYQNEKSLDFAW
jgi:hypothetical protein